MANKLTERILSRYVGTDMKVRVFTNGSFIHDLDLNGEMLDHIIDCQRRHYNTTHKLILRPLTDLTKPCLEGGKVPIRELYDMMYPQTMGKSNDYRTSFIHNRIRFWQAFSSRELVIDFDRIEDLPYRIVNWLHENHFDTSNLIKQGLAININTLEVPNG